MFRKYEKIHRLGKEETDGILAPAEDAIITVQEKIDGANASIWMDEAGNLQRGSRNRVLPEDASFNGFKEWVEDNEDKLRTVFAGEQNIRLYGEWLVRHTIAYNATAYQQFYLFDVHDGDRFWTQEEVEHLAKVFDLNYAQVFYHGPLSDFNLDQLEEWAGTSELGDKGEGVVIKRSGWTNKFGDHCYAKIVTQEFKEENSTKFGGNNKFSDTYPEQYVVNQYMTLPRVKKVMQKLESELGRLDKKHTPRVANTCYHDMITEEAWAIAKDKRVIDFNQLGRLANKKAIVIFHDILDDFMSVAYNQSAPDSLQDNT